MTYRVVWLLRDGTTQVREHGHDLIAAKTFARRGSARGPIHFVIKTFKGFDIGSWTYTHGKDSGWVGIDPGDRQTWPYNAGSAEAKSVVHAEVQEDQRDAAGPSVYLLRPWIPVSWGRRTNVAFIGLLGLQQAFLGNYQMLLLWLLLPLFSPRLIPETATKLASDQMG